MNGNLKSLAPVERPKAMFSVLLALSAVVYVAAGLVLHRGSQVSRLDMDEQEYYQLSGELIHGQYTFSLRRPPVHLVVLAFLRLVMFDHLAGVQVLVSVIFSLSGPMMYLLARRSTGHSPFALSVGLATIFWPPFLYYGNTLYSETTALPLFLLLLLLLPRGAKVSPALFRDGRFSLAAGFVLGLCILVRPMYLIFTPLAVGIVALEERRWPPIVRRIGLLAAGAAIVVLPWSVCISRIAGRPILVSANGGETLSGGLNPVLVREGHQTTRAPDGREVWSGPGKWLPEGRSGYLTDAELELPYEQRDLLLRRRTLGWVAHHPGSALYLEAAKLLYMWGLYPFWNGAKQSLFGNLPTVAVIALGLLAMIRFRDYWRELSRFWMLPLFTSLVALVSWGSWRFRQPGDLGLILLGALFVWSRFVPPDSLFPQFPRDRAGEDAGRQSPPASRSPEPATNL